MKMMKLRIFLGVVLIVMLSLLSDAAAKKPTMEEVASKLSCYCGTCPHLVVTKCGCSTAEQIKVDVQRMIDQGMSEKQIIQWYVDKYGETVLAAPPTKGFNLTAWAVPFLAFFAGGFVLFSFLKKQQRGGERDEEGTTATPGIQPAAPETAEDAEYRRRLEEELDRRK